MGDSIKVRIVQPVRGHRIGDVIELSRVDFGLYMAFGWAVPYIERAVEHAVVVPLEERDGRRRGGRRGRK